MRSDPLYLALDLEFNQPSGRLIQVGVCLGQPGQPENDFLTRSWFLSPGEPLAPEIVELTGITEEILAEQAVPLEQCALELSELIGQNQVFPNPVTWGSGDSDMLKNYFASHALHFPHFGRRCLDVKTLAAYLSLSAAGGPRSTSGGLPSIMGRYKLAFKGQQHRADVDAFNTLRLFFKLLERQRALEAQLQMLKPWL